MTHLRIELNESAVEYVNSAVITKLYELATGGDLDVTSNLLGTLHATATYNEYITALTTAYPNLHITATKYYLYLGDATFTLIIATRFGDGTGCTLSDLSSVNVPMEDAWGGLSGNTNITEATGLKYFTSIRWDITHPGYINGLKDCTNLLRCELPEGMLYLSAGSTYGNMGFFKNCSSLTYVSLPSTLTKISENCFENCSSLQSILLPGNLTEIAGSAFAGAGLTSITLPSSLLRIGDYAFGFSSLTSIHIPSSVTNLGGTLCLGCPLTSITFDLSSGSALTIGSGSLWGSGFITFSSNLMPGLTTIDFPARLSTIGQHPFRGLSALTTLIFRGTTPPTSSGDGLDVPSGCTIYVPDAAVTTYQLSTWFSPHSSKIQPLSNYTPPSS